jgi:hypothetical protein
MLPPGAKIEEDATRCDAGAATAATPGCSSGPSEATARRDRRLHLLLERLPAEIRTLFVMRFEQDLRYRDIAERVGSTEQAVKQRFSRTLRLLRRRRAGRSSRASPSAAPPSSSASSTAHAGSRSSFRRAAEDRGEPLLEHIASPLRSTPAGRAEPETRHYGGWWPWTISQPRAWSSPSSARRIIQGAASSGRGSTPGLPST